VEPKQCQALKNLATREITILNSINIHTNIKYTRYLTVKQLQELKTGNYVRDGPTIENRKHDWTQLQGYRKNKINII